jgi:nascent polypeptide-associated complex subunit alpha
MIPGLGRGMNPHKMKRMMKQMGINIQEFDDVEEIIIRTADKEYVFGSDVAVTVMTAQGQKTFQIVGDPSVRERSESTTAESGSKPDIEVEEETVKIPPEDVELVCQQTGVSEEEAREALEACNGNPAEAILKLMEE